MLSMYGTARTGSSPRMRGSLLRVLETGGVRGIIPAHAGLTVVLRAGVHVMRDHPRACGAHRLRLTVMRSASGSSPRMRGSPCREVGHGSADGIIPAHAGLTDARPPEDGPNRDHPRACGAHTCSSGIVVSSTGSSPRMRGSQGLTQADLADKGIIPAHAGLTEGRHVRVTGSGDHPRACGAHCMAYGNPLNYQGSSPRMRGSRSSKRSFPSPPGIIPAHAGLTKEKSEKVLDRGDHPRACGAHHGLATVVAIVQGSSPRMRGSRGGRRRTRRGLGIIPAHAGLTVADDVFDKSHRDHPRACGAHQSLA